MKRYVAIVIIFVLLIGFGVFEQLYFNQTLTVMETRTERLLTAVKADPEGFADDDKIDAAKELLAYWDKHKQYYEMLLSHTYTMEFERSASVLPIHMEQEDYLMTTTDLSALYEYCGVLRETITPHLHTIF